MNKNSKNGKITLGGLADKIDRVSDNLDTLATITAKGFESVDKRFEQVDKRFEQVDKRFERVDKKLEFIESRIDNVDTKVDRIDSEVNELVNRAENIDSSWGREIRQVKKRVDKLEGVVSVRH